MNNIVTAIVSGQEKSSAAITPTTGNTSQIGFSAVVSDVSKSKIESFQQALQNFRDNVSEKVHTDDTEINGNNMPSTALTTKLPAQNDHVPPTVNLDLDDFTVNADIDAGVTAGVQLQADISLTENIPVLTSQMVDTELENTPLDTTPLETIQAINVPTDEEYGVQVAQAEHKQVMPSLSEASKIVSTQTVDTREDNVRVPVSQALNTLADNTHAATSQKTHASIDAESIAEQQAIRAQAEHKQVIPASAEASKIVSTNTVGTREDNVRIPVSQALNTLTDNNHAAFSQKTHASVGTASKAVQQAISARAEHQLPALENNADTKHLSAISQLPAMFLTRSSGISHGEATPELSKNHIQTPGQIHAQAKSQTMNLETIDIKNDGASDSAIKIMQDSHVKLSTGITQINQSLANISAIGSSAITTPQMSSSEINVSVQNNVKINQLLSALPTESVVDIDGELGMLPSQMQTMLKVETSSLKKMIQAGSNRQLTDNITPVGTGLDSALKPSADAMLLKPESAGLLNQFVMNVTNQQATHTNLPASLISQVASAQNLAGDTDTTVDSSPLVTNIVGNSLSTANTVPIHQAVISETFGRPQWSQAMGKQILSMVNQHIGRAEIRLNPGHLGQIEVLIDMSDDNVNVSLSSRHAVVREAMELAMPKLREMLDENGFNLADTDISKHSFAEQREQSSSDDKRNVSVDRIDEVLTSELREKVMKHDVLEEGAIDYYI